MSQAGEMEEPNLSMRISMEVLEHLGMKMYTSLPAVISEYVANAWDAGAENVDVFVPDEQMSSSYEITIEDDGRGMTPEEVDSKFLIVGRNRRDEEESDEVVVDGNTRKVMGRKGIGKLAGFGVAGKVIVRTCRDGQYVKFVLDYESIKEDARQADKDEKGEHDIHIEEYGTTDDPSGTTVTLTNFDRSRRPSIENVRKNLARRFGVVSAPNFELQLNGEPIEADERNLRRTCQYVWDIFPSGERPDDDDDDGEEEYEGRIEKRFTIDGTIDEARNLSVRGWVGTRKSTVGEMSNGVAVMARNKLAQEPDFYGVELSGTRGQHALTYMLGEVHAEFLDEGEYDLIATDRASVHWEKEPASTLRDWLKATLKDICADWAAERKSDRLEEVRQTDVYQNRIAHLSDRERRLADNFLNEVAKLEGYDDETMRDMADYVANAVEKKAFQDLLDEIRSGNYQDPAQVVTLFDEWEVLDAVETLRRAKDRLEVIEELEHLIETDPDERSFQDLLGKNPTLLDPRWDGLDTEVWFSNKLKEKFGDDAELDGSDRRMDIVCLGDAATLKIVELKRPGTSIGWNELDQLEQYVTYIRGLEGTELDERRNVTGHIIGGNLADSTQARQKAEGLERQGMYVRTYEDLRRSARSTYEEFIEVVEDRAEEKGDERLMSRIEDVKAAGSDS